MRETDRACVALPSRIVLATSLVDRLSDYRLDPKVCIIPDSQSMRPRRRGTQRAPQSAYRVSASSTDVGVRCTQRSGPRSRDIARPPRKKRGLTICPRYGQMPGPQPHNFPPSQSGPLPGGWTLIARSRSTACTVNPPRTERQSGTQKPSASGA